MEKYEEAAKECWIHLALERYGTMTQMLAIAFRWYEDKYLAEALTAAVEMRMHASYTDAMLEEKREKKTCETCAFRARIGCPFNACPDALDFVLKIGTGRFGCTYYCP